MANTAEKAAPAAEPQWEDVQTGLGDEWPIEERPLVGAFIGMSTKELTGADGKDRVQSIYQFAPQEAPDTIAFIWGSYQLDEAFREISRGTLCRVTFTGRRQFKDDSGQPRQVKNYRVQISR